MARPSPGRTSTGSGRRRTARRRPTASRPRRATRTSRTSSEARTIARCVVTFDPKFADWPSLFNPLYPASTNQDPAGLQRGLEGPPADDSRSVQAGAASIRPPRRSPSSATTPGGGHRPSWIESSSASSSPTRRSTPSPTAKSTAWTSGPTRASTNRARAIADVDIRAAGGPNFGHLTFNGTSPNLQDVRVRRAIAKGIDRTTIVRALLGPLGITPMVLNNHIYMANQKGYQDNSDDVGKFDQDSARQLLDQAGWTLDGKVRRKDGRPLQVSFVIPSGISTSRQVAELVQNMLGQIGVTVQINTVPVSDFFDKYITPGQFESDALLMDRHALPRQLVQVHLREAEDERPGPARSPPELRAHRLGRARRAVRRGDPGPRIRRRRSRTATRSTGPSGRKCTRCRSTSAPSWRRARRRSRTSARMASPTSCTPTSGGPSSRELAVWSPGPRPFPVRSPGPSGPGKRRRDARLTPAAAAQPPHVSART